MCAKLLQLCLTLWDPMDHSPPGSSVHAILQTRITEWVCSYSPSKWSWDNWGNIWNANLLIKIVSSKQSKLSKHIYMNIIYIYLFIYINIYICWLCHETCRILVPCPGIEPMSSTLGTLSFNHWTTKGVPKWAILIKTVEGCCLYRNDYITKLLL